MIQRKGIILAGGLRHTALSGDKSGLQTTVAYLRQADDLLSPQHTHAGGHSRHSHYLYSPGYATF